MDENDTHYVLNREFEAYKKYRDQLTDNIVKTISDKMGKLESCIQRLEKSHQEMVQLLSERVIMQGERIGAIEIRSEGRAEASKRNFDLKKLGLNALLVAGTSVLTIVVGYIFKTWGGGE